MVVFMGFVCSCGGHREDDQSRSPAPPPDTVRVSPPPGGTIFVPPPSRDTIVFTFSDLDGFYVLREPVKIELGLYVVEALTLGPGVALVLADDRGDETVSQCREHTVLPDTVHIVCQLPSSETVTLDGHFLGTRVADALEISVPPGQDPYKIDVLTVLLRVSRRGDTLYQKRHAFTLRPGE